MPGTDFFDDDLQNREANRRAGGERAGGAITRDVSDLNLTRLARHKEEVEQQVARSAQELDRLRMRQEELERERRELEDLRKKQESYERGRRDVTERINQSLIMMEKEQLRTQRMVEVLQGTREEFKSLRDAIAAIDPDAWPDEQVREELAKALVVIDESRMEYNKGITRIEAMLEGDRKRAPVDAALLPDGGEGGRNTRHSFGFWFKAGLAFSLPLLLTLLALAAAFLVLARQGLL